MTKNSSAPSQVSAIAPGAALTPQQARDAGVADQAQQQMSNNGANSNTQKPQQQGGLTAESDRPQEQQQADTGNNAGQQASTEPSPSKQQGDSNPDTQSGDGSARNGALKGNH